MTNPTIRIHNLQTDEVIDREMSESELAQWEADNAQAEAENKAAKLLRDQKAALLLKLGITEDEARLLLG